MTTLAIYSNKGGVGKTATAVNLAHVASRNGFKTLICDLDPQGSATYYFRVRPKVASGAKALLRGGAKLDRSIKGTDFADLDLLPADFTYRRMDLLLNRVRKPRKRLNKILASLKRPYDLTVLDCPAALNLFAESVFQAADAILIPLVPTTLSLHSHRQLLDFYGKRNLDQSSTYVFFSMVDRRKKMHRELMEKATGAFTGVLGSTIASQSQIERMGVKRAPVAAFAPRSPAALSYFQLWEALKPHILNAKSEIRISESETNSKSK
jgi:cellulose biosynthesis protein BcsQ